VGDHQWFTSPSGTKLHITVVSWSNISRCRLSPKFDLTFPFYSAGRYNSRMSTNTTDTTPLATDVFLNSDGTSNHGQFLIAMGALTGASLFCNIELWGLIWITFKRRTGLYFWSILVATIGSFLYNINVILGYFVTIPVPTWAFGITGVLGYLIYVPAEYFVLYSRLHLLSTSPRVLRWTIVVVATEYALVTIPLAVFWTWGMVDPQSNTVNFVGDRLQQIEVCAYTAVGIILSSIYFIQTVRMWGTSSEPLIKRVLVHLVCINALLVLLDFANVAILFTDSIGLDNGWIVSQSTRLAV
jgi:hypothetical protein